MVPPESVRPEEVKGVGVASNEDDQRACEREITASGAKILYRSETGLILIDRTAGELKLSACRMTFSGNDKVDLPRVTLSGGNSSLPDLPTLLKLIPAEEIGARTFVKNNPTFDGRGVKVGILDTGVEIDHPMLRKTPTGEDKVIDFHDFSGEGRVSMQAATVTGSTLVGTDGQTYQLPEGSFEEAQFGIFAGSTLRYSEDVAAKDTFKDVAVISYLGADRKRRARIDTNGDRSFADETELCDFAKMRAFVKLGDKKSLTVSVKISPDGRNVTLCFDDGSHGTHVAGISTGFDPNGLQGVAPGAQVIAVKIGDNRLSGGSTTTASMLLAIDYAVSRGAQVINLSYGIRSGSNTGKSTIDEYVDKVAREKGTLFAISAGNEGPGLLTTGTPAGANLAITNAAFVSKQTAQENYGYAAVEDDNTWYFSSVGPRLDGGLKPTLLAPGSALSAVPPWAGTHANYRGTSMASPQVTGGLALLLSAAKQSELPMDRVSVTSAVYRGAKSLPSLALVEQGHGLMNVINSLEILRQLKGALAIEYEVKTNSVTTPDSKGMGIYVRARSLPENLFTVTVTPRFPAGTPAAAQEVVKTYKLVPSEAWIKTPPTLWMTSGARPFQVELDRSSLAKPGLHSAKIVAIDEATGREAFLVPVTVVAPLPLGDAQSHRLSIAEEIRVGQTLRYFIDVPAGTTSLIARLESDGPFLWGQLLNPEGRLVGTLRDSEVTSPLVPVSIQANITRPGVYELDIVAPANIPRRARFIASLRALSLTASAPVVKPGKGLEIEIQNNFEALKFIPKGEITAHRLKSVVNVTGDAAHLPLSLAAEDLEQFSEVKLTVNTAKEFYDLMTDYPFRVFDAEKAMIASGGLELSSEISLPLEEAKAGTLDVEITGAFTMSAPTAWGFQIVEERILKSPKTVFTGKRTTLETGQSASVTVDPPSEKECVSVRLEGLDGQTLQSIPVCK